MANTLRIKRRLTGASGAPTGLALGELAHSFVDDKLWIGNGSTSIVIGGEGHFATSANLASEVSTLNSSISSENSRAVAAEQALGVRIDNVLSNVDGDALDSLTEVVAAFEAADQNLNGAITSLANSASSDYQLLHAADGNHLYLGRLAWADYPSTGPAEDAEEWTIYKITTDAAGNVLSEQSAVGQWSNKESLTYA